MLRVKTVLFSGLIVLSGVAASVSAFAQDKGFYAGVAVGQSTIRGACDGVPLSCDDTDTGWKLTGGYQFNKNFGAEIGYVDLGKASASGVLSGASVSASVKAKGWEVLGVGTLPIADKFSAYGKVGFFRWDADLSATAAIPGRTAALAVSDSGTDFTFGLGVKYDITNNIAGRLEWQRYQDIGNSATTGQGDVDLISLGVLFKF